MLTKTIALLLTVVGATSASSVHSSSALRGDDEDPISNLRSSLITTNRNLAAPKKKTLKKKKKKKDGEEPPFGNANGKDKEVSPSCKKELSLTLEITISPDSIDLEALGTFILGALGFGVLGQWTWLGQTPGFFLGGQEGGQAVGDTYGGLIGRFFQFAFAATAATIVAGTAESFKFTDFIYPVLDPGSSALAGAKVDVSGPFWLVREIVVEEKDDGNLSVGYGLSLCKKDGSEIDDNELGLIVAGFTEALDEFVEGLTDPLGAGVLGAGFLPYL